MRVFLAVGLPAGPREVLAGLVSELAPAAGSVRWVRKESLHLTLRFLGDLPDGRVEDLGGKLASERFPLPPFPVSLEGMGCFPPKGPPRVVWVGIGEGKGRLAELFGRLEEVLGRAGFPREARGFAPHLTIGRVRGRPDPGLRDLLSRYRERCWGRFLVGEFALMESRLSPGGARYRALETFPLRGSGLEA